MIVINVGDLVRSLNTGAIGTVVKYWVEMGLYEVNWNSEPDMIFMETGDSLEKILLM